MANFYLSNLKRQSCSSSGSRASPDIRIITAKDQPKKTKNINLKTVRKSTASETSPIKICSVYSTSYETSDSTSRENSTRIQVCDTVDLGIAGPGETNSSLLSQNKMLQPVIKIDKLSQDKINQILGNVPFFISFF